VHSPEGTGICYGDSGSPALALAHGRWTLRGTASRIIDQTCGTSNSVYTDASSFRAEITRMLQTGSTSGDHRTTSLTATSSNRHLWPTFHNPVQ
jgi:hypothetical protein